MSKKVVTDEIDLLEIIFVIWKKKWSVILITLLFFILSTLYYFSNKQPIETKKIAETEIRPITVYDEAQYKIYNSFIRQINKPTSPYVNSLNSIDQNIDDSYIIKLIDENTDSDKRFNNIYFIYKKFLFELFIEKLNQKSHLIESIKKYEYIENQNLDKQQYENTVLNFANSIKFLNKNLKETLEETKFQQGAPIIIQHITNNEDKWENFLKFFEMQTNLEIQKNLSQMFKNYIDYAKTINQYEIEDTEVQIANAMSDEESLILHRKKKLLMENKIIQRMENIFSNSPISKFDQFYAARIIYDSTTYKIDRKISVNKKIILVGSFLGFILGVFYALITNALQLRRSRKVS